MLSVATAAVHRSMRQKTPTPSSSPTNIIVDTKCTWKTDLTQSGKRRRSHQGPCSARKKLIQSPTEDLALNLNINNSVTLTPIRKARSNTDSSTNNGNHQLHVDVGKKCNAETPNDISNGSDEEGVYLIVEVHDDTGSPEKNKEMEGSETESKNCSVLPFIDSDEISIRPIHRKMTEKNIPNSELSVSKLQCEETFQISKNEADIPQTQLQIIHTSRMPECTQSVSSNAMKSTNNLGCSPIATKTFYKKSPDQKPAAVKPLSIAKKSASSGSLAKIEKAIQSLKKSSPNYMDSPQSLVNNSIRRKLNTTILSSTPKVEVITNPVVPNLHEICTPHKNFETPDVPEEMLSPWNVNSIAEDTETTLLDSGKQLDTLETPYDMLEMTHINLEEPYHMTGFPNPPGENRCWLNATLQALFAMPLLDTFHNYNLQDCSKIIQYLITTKAHWMKGAKGRDKAYQTVKLLKEELGVLDKSYSSEGQQDVSEFLTFLLNHIKSDLWQLISAEDAVHEIENVPTNLQDSQKAAKLPQTPNKRQPLADISTPTNNGIKRCHSLGDPNQSPRIRKQILTHSVQDLLSPKLRKLSNPTDPSYKVHTPPLVPSNDDIISYRNPVNENFKLYLMEHYTCKECQKHRQRKVNNFMLFVDIPSDDSLSPIDLQKAVENLFAPEERHLTCGTCKHDAHTMRILFSRQPNILTLQVNRYGMSSEGIFSKISSDVKIPRKLDLSATLVDNVSGGSDAYKPICIIAHAGGTMDCGHYTSYVKHADQWYHYNDMNVAPMTEDEALTAAQMTAYLVFFMKSTSAEQDSDQV